MSSKKKTKPLAINVVEIDLIHHDGAFSITTHIDKDQASFAEQCPQPELIKPEEEFALLQLLAVAIDAVNKCDQRKPEGVVLRAMAKNFVTRETAAALANGAPINPQNPDEFKSQQFRYAMKVVRQKHKEDAPKRDAIACIEAAARGYPMTANDVFLVFEMLAEGMQLTPKQRQQFLQDIAQIVRGMNKEMAEEWRRQMAAQRKPSPMDVAKMMVQTVDVKPDGTFAVRHIQQVVPTLQKPEVAMNLLELARDFWLALFKARQDQKLQDGVQRDVAVLLKNIGQKYVHRGNARLVDATTIDANANHLLIKTLRQNPTMRADKAKMAALDKLAKAEATGQAPGPGELMGIYEELGKAVIMKPDMLRTVFRRQQPELRMPEEQFAVLDLLAKVLDAMKKPATDKPEGVVLRAMAKNFVTQEAMQALNSGAPVKPQKPDEFKTKQFANAMQILAQQKHKNDAAKRDAIMCVAAAAEGRALPAAKLVPTVQILAEEVQMAPETVPAILERLSKNGALTPNEKVEMENRLSQNPPQSPIDVVHVAYQLREEQKEAVAQAYPVKAKLVDVIPVSVQSNPAGANPAQGSRMLQDAAEGNRMAMVQDGAQNKPAWTKAPASPVWANPAHAYPVKAKMVDVISVQSNPEQMNVGIDPTRANPTRGGAAQGSRMVGEGGATASMMVLKSSGETNRPGAYPVQSSPTWANPAQRSPTLANSPQSSPGGTSPVQGSRMVGEGGATASVMVLKSSGETNRPGPYPAQSSPTSSPTWSNAAQPSPAPMNRGQSSPGRASPSQGSWMLQDDANASRILGKPAGLRPPEEEMARLVLVQGQMEDGANVGNEKKQQASTQGVTTANAAFRSVLKPQVVEKYKESMAVNGNWMGMSVLQNMPKPGAMDDRQLGQKVDQLLTTLTIDRQKMRNVLQETVKDRQMTNEKAKNVERQCESLLVSGGGKIRLTDLRSVMMEPKR